MRVLVCRARADGLRTADTLAAAGHEAMLAPVLDVAALPVRLPAVPPDAVVATSLHAVAFLGAGQAGPSRVTPAFAVGDRTAGALAGAGWRTVHTAGGSAAALITLVEAALPAPARLLYLAGRTRAPDLERGLKAAGYAVEVVETYEARRAAPWDSGVVASLGAGHLAACLHFSARSARLALDFAACAGCEAAFARLPHLCLSEVVADVLRPRAVSAPLVLALSDPARLAQALSGIGAANPHANA